MTYYSLYKIDFCASPMSYSIYCVLKKSLSTFAVWSNKIGFIFRFNSLTANLNSFRHYNFTSPFYYIYQNIHSCKSYIARELLSTFLDPKYCFASIRDFIASYLVINLLVYYLILICKKIIVKSSC